MKKAAINRIRCDLAGAFSLLELMVVISVTSLLLSILIPTLNRCRSLARQSVWQSLLKQWGLAIEAYSSENNGFYPHIDGRDRTEINPQTPQDFADYYYGWVDVLPTFINLKPWRDYELYNKPGTDTIFNALQQ